MKLRGGAFPGEVEGNAKACEGRTEFVGNVCEQAALGSDEGFDASGHAAQSASKLRERRGAAAQGGADASGEVAIGEAADGGADAASGAGKIASEEVTDQGNDYEEGDEMEQGAAGMDAGRKAGNADDKDIAGAGSGAGDESGGNDDAAGGLDNVVILLECGGQCGVLRVAKGFAGQERTGGIEQCGAESVFLVLVGEEEGEGRRAASFVGMDSALARGLTDVCEDGGAARFRFGDFIAENEEMGDKLDAECGEKEGNKDADEEGAHVSGSGGGVRGGENEKIADAADAFDEVAVAEFAAEAADVDVDAAVEGVEFAAEDAAGKLAARDDAAGMIEEQLEEVEFEGSEGDAGGGAADFAGAGIEFDIADAEQEGRGRRMDAAMAAEDGADACGELAGVERLGHVIVGAELEAEEAGYIFAAGCEHDDGNLAGGADALEDFCAGQGGEHNVEDDEIEIAAEGADGAFAAIVDGLHVHAFRGEIFADQRGKLTVIIHEENFFHVFGEMRGGRISLHPVYL